MIIEDSVYTDRDNIYTCKVDMQDDSTPYYFESFSSDGEWLSEKELNDLIKVLQSMKRVRATGNVK